MALVIRTLVNVSTEAMTKFGDSRSEDWFLMKSLFPILGLLTFYAYFVLNLGPCLMERRKPFDINRILTLYNAVQVVASGYVVYKFITALPHINFWCQEVDYITDHGLRVAELGWVYFCIKVFDLLDTVFFVLRKRQRQISFLHVYHHIGMVVAGWLGLKFAPGGTSIFLPGYNSIVHTAMYIYYLISVQNNRLKDNLWWKKHITQLQLVQFVLLMFQFGLVLFQPKCNYPKWIPCVLIPQYLFMFILFSNFYIKTYIKTERAKNQSEMD